MVSAGFLTNSIDAEDRIMKAMDVTEEFWSIIYKNSLRGNSINIHFGHNLTMVRFIMHRM
jgi:hypothetical protein